MKQPCAALAAFGLGRATLAQLSSRVEIIPRLVALIQLVPHFASPDQGALPELLVFRLGHHNATQVLARNIETLDGAVFFAILVNVMDLSRVLGK